MDNFEAIKKMSREQLEAFLDNVYCTGLNNGMYASRQPEGEAVDILDKCPFDAAWLSDDAEPATLCDKTEDDEYLLDALTKSIIRSAGIDVSQSVKETENKKTINIAMSKKKQ